MISKIGVSNSLKLSFYTSQITWGKCVNLVDILCGEFFLINCVIKSYSVYVS